MKNVYLAFVALLFAFSGNASAGIFIPSLVVAVPGGTATQTQTKAYAGLVWTLGGQKPAAMPAVVVGVRSIKVQSDDRVSNGADLSARFTLSSGFAFDSARLSYVAGKRDLLGNLGVGYSNANKSFLTSVAVQGSYTRLGMDYEYSNRSFVPYLEFLSVRKPAKVNQEQTLACDNPAFTLPANPSVGDACNGGPV